MRDRIRSLLSEGIGGILGHHYINLIHDFGDSKVVDGQGKPLLMHHGGSYSAEYRKVNTFKGVGWFTSSKKDARHYANQQSGSVTSAFLVIRNPLYTSKLKNKYKKDIETNRAIKIAIENGFDGVIDEYEDGKILDAIVFNHNQILFLDDYIGE